jgi:predicted kinase
MVRLPDDRRTDGLLREGRLSRNDVTTFASTLAVFHARARCDDQTAKYGAVEVISANVEENFAETDESLEQFLTPTQAQALRRWQRNFLWDHGPLFRRRAAQGRVRDGHGDLRLEHVYLFQGEAPVVVDCIEFNDRLRFGDVASDIAFYATELVEQGRADLAEAFLARYARDADDYDLYSLVDFYGSYRAFVRGKVLTLVWRDPTISNSLREKAAEEARKYFLLAWAATRRPLVPPQLVAVTGLLASGKSTVAEILSELLAAPIIEADRTRKALLGVAPEEPLRDAPWTGAYTHELTQQVYDELFRRAKLVLASGRSVILDASFRSKAQRSALRQWAHRMHLSPVLVECQAPEDVCRRRLQERERQGTVSDGRLELFEPFRAQFEPVTEWPEASHLVISTDTSREALRETLGQALTAMAITKGATIRP